jgi:hypothetical protein
MSASIAAAGLRDEHVKNPAQGRRRQTAASASPTVVRGATEMRVMMSATFMIASSAHLDVHQ